MCIVRMLFVVCCIKLLLGLCWLLCAWVVSSWPCGRGCGGCGGTVAPLFRLLNDRGDLLVCTCPTKDVAQEKVCAAISSNIWSEYCKAAKSTLDGSATLDFLILDFEGGKVAIAGVAHNTFILCSHMSSTVHMGMVRAKVWG
jgi:hypothetical protein